MFIPNGLNNQSAMSMPAQQLEYAVVHQKFH